MVCLGACTIKEIQLKEASATSGEETKPNAPPKKKKLAHRHKSRQAKSKAKVKTEQSQSSSDENCVSKSAGCKGVKNSTKPVDKDSDSSGSETKTIIKDRSLLICETIDDVHVEHEARHRAKLAGTLEILQAEVSSHLNATTKFGEDKVETCYFSHKQATAAHCESVTAELEDSDLRNLLELLLRQKLEMVSNLRSK